MGYLESTATIYVGLIGGLAMNNEIPNNHVQKMINDAIKGTNTKYYSSENELFNELGLNRSNEEVKHICGHKDLTIDQKIFSIKMIAKKAPKTKYDKENK